MHGAKGHGLLNLHASEPEKILATPPLPAASVSWALFLDIDGTLVELEAHPEMVCIAPATLDLLHSLASVLHGALAMLSGRNLSDIDRLLTPLILPAGALHGIERRDVAGRLTTVNPPAEIAAQVGLACRQQADLLQNVWVEEKSGIAFALHFRAAPHQREAVIQRTKAIAASSAGWYSVQLGNGVAELKPAGSDKGAALRALLDSSPFQGRVPVVLGDDLTDETAFAMAEQLGGLAIVVGDRRPTLAHYALDSPKDVIKWLETLVEHLRKLELAP